MGALHPNLRKKLEKAVIKARDIAEKAAKSALQSLAVDNHQPFDHMSPEQRQLRVKLRARGRAIGDRIDAKGKQGLWHLIREAAYEHWHRMLFARFLAENNLLMHPDGVAVTLDECEELATDEGLDKWELASRYAATMLPAIFRPDDPVLQIEFAPEDKLQLERLLTDLEPDVFQADDSLGWVYQFWQAKRKDEVNASETKIGADELPAVTQLFTEDYMVKFLLHNSLGAWWAGKFLAKNPEVAKNKDLTENDLCKAIAFDDYQFDFLRFVFDEDANSWMPAAGSFEGWPKEAKDITVLDPCCGSGHFLVAVFELMVRIRMAEEGLSEKEAVDAVLRDNIFGLEIDARCTQIAAFALAFAAWKFPKAESFRELPQLNIACSGIPVTAKKEDWLKLANGDEKLKNGMDRLWSLFRQAPVLGSLIDPTVGDKHELLEAKYGDMEPLITTALSAERVKLDYDLTETAVAAKGITQANKLLSKTYTFVITNVPYLGRGKHDDLLKDFCDRYYSYSKSNLATTFIERCLSFTKQNGTYSLVTPQNWFYQDSYKYLRKKLLQVNTWNLCAKLGPGAFETISGEVVNVVLTIITNGELIRDSKISSIDVNSLNGTKEKTRGLIGDTVIQTKQIDLLDVPDNRIILIGKSTQYYLGEYAKSTEGTSTGDGARFLRKFWELPSLGLSWSLFQSGPTDNNEISGCCDIVFWENGKGALSKSSAARIQGHYAWAKRGVIVKRMGEIRCGPYYGNMYDKSCIVLTPNDEQHYLPILAYALSEEFTNEVRKLDKNISIATSVFEKIPFEFDKQREKELLHHFNFNIECNDPTQWIFKGTVNDATEPFQVAAARLLGYRWLEQTDESVIEKLVDEDGIVCIPAVGGEQPTADRLRAVLAAAFGDEWSPAKETELLTAADGRRGLEDWLRNKYFVQHCKLFHNRPFIWHVWDGERDGFAALVNYHKLDKKLLETLTYSYLGDWINKQKADSEAGVSGAERRMLAAQILQKQLQLILKGEKPYDTFVRWKPIEEQSIGWEPDLNDGVRMNIRPFFEADILRKKPNIKWTKDRGKEPTSSKEKYPWFWDGSEFAGERVNDVHLSLQEKQEAREKAAKETVNK